MLEKIINLGISKVEAQELLKVSKDIEKDYSKLLKDYPIQYLIGNVNFYGYTIFVNENVLIPRRESEELVEKTIKYIKKYLNENVSILDLCSGSGAIGIALKKQLINSNVTCSEISQKAIDVSLKNIKYNNVDIAVIKSDLFNNINCKYDVIISNPPYISKDEKIDDSVKKYEPSLALYAEDNGLYFYKEIIGKAKNYINKKYIIAFEIGYWQSSEIIKYAKNVFHNNKIFVEKDLSNRDRFIFIINE